MKKEISFSLIFTFGIYLVCTNFYEPALKVQANPFTYTTNVRPFEIECRLEEVSEEVAFRQKIKQFVAENATIKFMKKRTAHIIKEKIKNKKQCEPPQSILENIPDFKNYKKVSKYQREPLVAVIDTGIDLSNPYLSKNIYLPISISDINSLDFSGKNDIKDYHGHGSHITGIILSVMPDARILPLKYYNSTNTGKENLKYYLEALRFAIEQDVDIINYSGGGPEFYDEEYKLLLKAKKKGILVITAAGNEKSDVDIKKNRYYPASYGLDNIISVGNVNSKEEISDSSNYGKSIDLFAYGEMIKSYGVESDSCFTESTGTSQSTSFVSGTVALVKAINPELGYREIKKIILENVKKTKNLDGFSKTGGILDIERTIASFGKDID